MVENTSGKKIRLLIVTDVLALGGVEKSLVTFLNSFRDCLDVDVLVWRKDCPEFISLPDFVNRLNLPVVDSLKRVISTQGLFSFDFFFSLAAFLSFGKSRKRRWLAMPRIKKEYDVSIAYSDKGTLKCFVIDKTSARKKYAFCHSGVYLYRNDEEMKAFDGEYFPKFDKVFAVSNCAKDALLQFFPQLNNIVVLPNLIDIENIRTSAAEECPLFSNSDKLRLLTVGRLCEQKNPLQIIETAKLLVDEQVDFIWAVVGDGTLYDKMREAIERGNLQDKVVLTGNQTNPYKYMKNCDVYLQFSDNESDGVTIREASVFDKPMILSDIPAFREKMGYLNNIRLFKSTADVVQLLKSAQRNPIVKNNIDEINNGIKKGIKTEIMEDF